MREELARRNPTASCTQSTQTSGRAWQRSGEQWDCGRANGDRRLEFELRKFAIGNFSPGESRQARRPKGAALGVARFLSLSVTMRKSRPNTH